MIRITDEAEQTVARRLFDREWVPGDWQWEQFPQPNRWQLLARQVLEAALPHLTDDGATAPPADTGGVTPTAAESATPVGAGDAAPSSPHLREILAAIDGERGYMDNWAGRARNDALTDAREAVEKLFAAGGSQ